MISIENFKLLEDLQEELKRDRENLDDLKESKSHLMLTKMITLFRQIYQFLEQKNLEVKLVEEPSSNNITSSFRAKYKNGYLRAEIDGEKRLKIILNGTVIKLIDIRPSIGKYTIVNKISWDDDCVLSNEIAKVYDEIENVKGTIQSYQSDKYTYVTIERDKETIIGDEKDVLNYLFLG